MRRYLPRAVRLVTHNFIWKLVALGIAVVIWILVASEPALSTFANVPLEYRNLGSDVEISSALMESVYLELRGPSSALSRLSDAHRLAVILDMTGIRAGERTFSIDSGNVRLPRGVSLVRAVPSQVRFEFERRLERSVPVKVRFKPSTSGYEVASFTVSPPELRVHGPESHVQRVTAVATDLIDLSGVVARAEFHANTFMEDAYVRYQDPPNVAVSVTMKKR